MDTGEQERHVLAALEAASLPPLELADRLTALADLYFSKEKYDQAEPIYWRALELSHQTLGPIDVRVAACLQDLAELYEIQGQFSKAEHLYECIMAILSDLPEMGGPDIEHSLRRIEGFYESRGQQGQMANVRTLRSKLTGVMSA